MEQEIKFRQPLFNLDGSFKEWFYWGLYKEDGFIGPVHRKYMGDKKIADPLDSQRYIGIKDKNNKEIFEGDKIRYQWRSSGSCWISFTGIVKYEAPEWYCGEDSFVTEGDEQPIEVKDHEIIGNIFEMP